jgi:lipopolysaccharide transport system permease protein
LIMRLARPVDMLESLAGTEVSAECPAHAVSTLGCNWSTTMRSRAPEVRRLSTIRAERRLSAQRWIHLVDLFRELLVRDMKLRYRGSVLGIAWTLLNPLAELLVLLFIFSTVLSLNISNYAAFLFTGLLVYGWFQSSLNFATGAIVNNRELIRRPGVPLSVLPIVIVASTLLHFIFSLPVLFVLLRISHIPITSAWLTLPLLIAVQFLLILSLSYPLATVHVWFRDTQYLLRIALQLLFYLTPIFYETTTIPTRYRALYHLNPMVSVVEAYRDVLLRGKYPDNARLARLSIVSAGLLTAGIIAFRHTSQDFTDEL